jgi:hypothetical protein
MRLLMPASCGMWQCCWRRRQQAWGMTLAGASGANTPVSIANSTPCAISR